MWQQGFYTRPTAVNGGFVKDRVCNRCGTRYTPPTPAWAALVFILLGIFFLGGSIGSFFFADDGRIIPRVIGIAIGASAIGLGFRSLANPSNPNQSNPKS
jgi:hypothetical protein